jgi:hypothetical protein
VQNREELYPSTSSLGLCPKWSTPVRTGQGRTIRRPLPFAPRRLARTDAAGPGEPCRQGVAILDCQSHLSRETLCNSGRCDCHECCPGASYARFPCSPQFLQRPRAWGLSRLPFRRGGLHRLLDAHGPVPSLRSVRAHLAVAGDRPSLRRRMDIGGVPDQPQPDARSDSRKRSAASGAGGRRASAAPTAARFGEGLTRRRLRRRARHGVPALAVRRAVVVYAARCRQVGCATPASLFCRPAPYPLASRGTGLE